MKWRFKTHRHDIDSGGEIAKHRKILENQKQEIQDLSQKIDRVMNDEFTLLWEQAFKGKK